MRTVFKYGPLEIGTPSVVQIPEGASIVAFSAQNGQNLYLWAEVDTDAPMERVRYIVVGTGHEIPPDRPWEQIAHVGTWVSDEYVWHLFVWP